MRRPTKKQPDPTEAQRPLFHVKQGAKAYLETSRYSFGYSGIPRLRVLGAGPSLNRNSIIPQGSTLVNMC